ncbi:MULTISPECIES: P-loop NTPase fold protein [unclassified Lacrimispora]|uniref:KAP family P-loop NTPase fold protein n=1 Tax=unclassified Lacrimispora TaxID=2719232 RepID=UPI00376F6448
MWIDRESEVDLLAYRPFADLVKDILLDDTMNPLTIGLLGSWGAGKSTLLELINHKLKDIPENKKIARITLNAWSFEGYDDAKSALMEALLLELKENTPEFSTYKKGINSLIKKINVFRLGKFAFKYGAPTVASMFSPLGLGGAAAYLGSKKDELIEDAKTLIKEEADDITQIDENTDVISNIREFKKEFQELIVDSKIDNLVVMIDDLDRCSPDRIIETLEAIKLFLSVPKTTYIIAIDDSVIKYSVKKTYPKIDNDDFGIVDNYIEKIIQLPIYIPELSDKDVTNYLLLLVVDLYFNKEVVEKLSYELTEKNAFFNGIVLNEDIIKQCIPEIENKCLLRQNKSYSDFCDMFKIVGRVAKVICVELKGNPRQAKRFLNTFIVRKKLGDIYDRDKSKKLNYEILAQLTALEYLDKELFRELYKACINPSNSEKVFELSLLFNIINNAEEFPNNLKDWDKPKMINWLKNANIKDIGGEELLKYFYLSRESLHINFSALDELTLDERKEFNLLINLDRPQSINKEIENMINKAGINSDKIIRALIESFREDYKLINKCLPIYIKLGEYRQKIIDVIISMKLTDVTARMLMTFNNMYRVDNNCFKPVLLHLKKIGLDEEKISIITKED